MNMYHNVKSLFVGAAVAGIGMLSGRAELKVSESLKNQIWNIVEGRLGECYRQVRAVVPNVYTDKKWEMWREEDTRSVYNLIVGQRFGLFHFCSLDTSFQSRDELKEYLGWFFEEQCPLYRQKVQFSNKEIERSALCLFRILSSIIDDGYGWNRELKNWYNSRNLAQQGIVNEEKYGFSVKRSFVFNDAFIGRIADAVFNSMTIVNKMHEITRTSVAFHEYCDEYLENELLRAYLSSVQNLYGRYLLLTDPKKRSTIAKLNGFIAQAELLCKNDLRFTSCANVETDFPADFLLSHPSEKEHIEEVFLNVRNEVLKWKEDVERIRDDREHADHVYWAPATVSDAEGAEILKELEEQEGKEGAEVTQDQNQEEAPHDPKEDLPNAFLEEID